VSKKANPKCPVCGSNKTIKKGSRNGLKRYLCKKQGHSFTVDHRPKQEPFWVRYIDGTPFRKLADQTGLSHGHVHDLVKAEMDSLPDNTWITKNYCNRWSGRLVVDGKYVKVKGYEKKIPFIYAIDYLTHDIPVGILAPSENGESFRKLFRLLKTCHYPLQIVIADQVTSLKQGLNYHYPTVPIQMCHTHYLENIRQQLSIRTDETYRRFFFRLSGAFGLDVQYRRRNEILWGVHHRYKDDPILNAIVMDIHMNYDNLFAFTYRKNKCPNSTNLIECYNSHLPGRLKTIKGFQTFKSAERFLNAWMIRRRTKPFTDCADPFKHLNGKASLQMSMKKQAKWPSILGVQAPDSER
jgi:hypothetical protein